MKFSNQLIGDASLYLKRKTGQKADKRLTEQFLKRLADLGILFKENVQSLGKES